MKTAAVMLIIFSGVIQIFWVLYYFGIDIEPSISLYNALIGQAVGLILYKVSGIETGKSKNV